MTACEEDLLLSIGVDGNAAANVCQAVQFIRLIILFPRQLLDVENPGGILSLDEVVGLGESLCFFFFFFVFLGY